MAETPPTGPADESVQPKDYDLESGTVEDPLFIDCVTGTPHLERLEDSSQLLTTTIATAEDPEGRKLRTRIAPRGAVIMRWLLPPEPAPVQPGPKPRDRPQYAFFGMDNKTAMAFLGISANEREEAEKIF